MAARDIRIIGGKSTKGRISVLSTEFLSTAKSDKAGNIQVAVKRLPLLSRFLYQHKRLPIPATLRLLLFLINSISLREVVLISFYLLGVAWLERNFLRLSQSSSFGSNLIYLFWAVVIVIFAGYIFYLKKFIAPWHGAEHMAIRAYQKKNSINLWDIALESPIHAKCGTRLALPLFVGSLVVAWLISRWEFNFWVTLLAVVECILWTDTLLGWDKVPLVGYISYLIQRYIAAAYPGEKELKTAQKAMIALVSAHRDFGVE